MGTTTESTYEQSTWAELFVCDQILVFLGVLITANLLMKWSRKKETFSRRYPPSLPCLPLIGSLSFIRDFKQVHVFFTKKSTELGPIFILRIGSRLILTLNSKDAIETAYIRNKSVFTNRPELVIDKLINPKNKGIAFVRKVKQWKKDRLLSLSVLKEFGFGVKNIMETRIHHEIEAMLDFIGKQKGEPFDPKELCSLVTLNIITDMLIGRRRDYDKGPSEFSTLILSLISRLTSIYSIVPFLRYIPPYSQRIKNLLETAVVAFENIESEIARSLEDTENSCFVQAYIQKAGPNYDRYQLNYVLRDLVAAGSDTSSTALQWSLVALANNPDVQKRLHDEIDVVLTGDRLPVLQDQAKFSYVEATILELTRWRTLIPLSVPRETSRNSFVGGYFIPGGTMVIANLHAAHNDVNLWKDPEVFRPERFLDSENNVVGKDRIIPFSIGRRSCLGETLANAELFLILTSLVKRFLILPPEGQDKVDDDPATPVSSVMYPKPFKIRLIERK